MPGLAALLKQLAQACPPDQDDTATRLWLKALAAVDAKTTKPDGASLPRLRTLLADPVRARRVMDILTNNAADLARALTARGTPERSSLLAALDTALLRLADDTTLSRADRLTALIGRVDLVRIDVGETVQVAVPAPLLDALRAQSSRADREISDGYERLAVIPTAAYGLAQAGRVDESDALLQANLVKSHSPYYLMSALASNAKRRNDSVAALRWSQQAFDSSVGAATRLQWGAAYVSLLVELAPQNEARIESAVQQVWALAGEQPDAFHERSARSLQRIGKRLGAWNKDGAHKAAVARLQTGLDAACARLDRGDPQRASCEAVMRLSGGKAA